MEHVTQTTAAQCGLLAARTSVAVYDGIEVLVVERYDRTAEGASRIHQEDMCQALGQPPNMKYQRDGGPTPADIAAVLRTHCDNIDDLQRFCDYLLFQWISASTDGHAKNFGLMLHDGAVRLAPLYDAASWLPYHQGQPSRRIQLSMKMGENYRLQSADRPSALSRIWNPLSASAVTTA